MSANARSQQLQVFELGSTIIAIVNVIRFQRRLKHHMVGRKALPKLLSFKLFVAITTIQHVSSENDVPMRETN